VGFFYALITLRLELLGGLTNGGCTCNQGAKPAQLIMERLVVGYTELRPTTVCQGTGLVWDRERWGEEWAAHGPWREAGWCECVVLRRPDDLDDLRSTVTAGYISVCGVP
jgi:hypothetical protein